MERFLQKHLPSIMLFEMGHEAFVWIYSPLFLVVRTPKKQKKTPKQQLRGDERFVSRDLEENC